jgi:hypothetical protein
MSPRKRQHVRSKLRKLTLDEELALAFGAPSNAFSTAAEARDAYFHNRDRMMPYGDAGHRPTSWWYFEAGEPRPRTHAAEAARLAQLGELSDSEIAKLRANARLFGDGRLAGGSHVERWQAVEQALDGKWEHKPEEMSARERLWWGGAL